jgi:GntR family transcriptional regulator
MLVSEGVDRSSPVPAWAQVAQILRRQMDVGAFEDGERLPSEQELATGFDVSRITIRQALSHLASEGYVERRQGVGTFVSPRPGLVQHDLSLSAPWRDRVKAAGHEAVSRQLGVAVLEKLPADLARRFPDTALAGELVYLRRLQCVDSQPIGLSESWVPAGLAPGLSKEPLMDGSLSLTLRERYGIRPAEVDSSVETTLANAADAQLLGTFVDAPLFVVVALSRQRNGELIDVSRTSWLGGRVRFRFVHHAEADR